MVDFIVGAIIVALVAMAVTYIVRAKKRGAKCIGCSAAGACAHACAGGCTCGTGSCHAEFY
ncbi:MAG: FeoB-associated Cys-rich membrane protein [Ruminiclostridium sp.]|nr:FeoB-associated Cys-rich membrane protein [Ruminiclostridium sp.]